MRILQLVTMRQRRGAEVFATQLSDALTERGHDVRVAGLYPAPVDALDPIHAATIDLPVASRSRFSVSRLAAVVKLIRTVRPDVIQANGSETLKYSACAQRLTGHDIPIVYRNISMASQWVRGSTHRAWGRWLVRVFDHVTSVSEESGRDFGTTYAVPAERRSVIRRGILIPERVDRTAARRQLEALTGAGPDASLLVHIGSFSDEKNQGWLVDTFRRIHAARPEAHLVLIGAGELRDAVDARVRAHGLEACVHLLGQRADAAALVAAADLFVLPSKIEGIPGVVLEAAAQAVPSVATDVGGMREAVRDGETGLLVASGDENAFASAVLALLADESRRTAMGAAARQLVRERFSMAATASAFEALYATLLRGRRGSEGAVTVARGITGSHSFAADGRSASGSSSVGTTTMNETQAFLRETPS
jgi:glycosyltransferase involved in cell wall biosynthesis